MAVDFFSLGQRIQTKRKAKSQTQENMAEALGVSVGYVSQIERGLTKVNLEMLSSICDYLNCDISEVLSGTFSISQNYLTADMEQILSKLSPSNRKTCMEIAQVLLKNQEK